MADPLSPAVSQRICAHMNDDHADAVLLYAKVFGNATEANAAEMVAIDPDGMDLMTQVNGSSVPLRIPFERPLTDSEDAHHVLIDLVKQARQQAKSQG
jgi:putative heme iron utilization protein